MNTILRQTDLEMKTQLVTCNIVKMSKIRGGGFGVFAGKDYKKGEMVEKCVFIELSNDHTSNGVRPEIDKYVFESHLTPNKEILVLGNGSLFNHSENNNIQLIYNENKPHNRVVFYTATKPIKKNMELFINYGKGWFEHNNIVNKQLV